MYAAIYIPEFPLQAVVRNEPDLRRQGVAIVEGKPPLSRVVATNQKARAEGVTSSMTGLEVGQIPELQIRRRSPAEEAAAHAALLDLGLSVSPRVEDTATDTLVIDLAGVERLSGSPEKIAPCLAERAARLGLEARVAVASNPDAAIHAARGFRGITLIPAGEEAKRLGGLPVDVLAPPPEILETLYRWGVRTFQALAALPALQLSERLGQAGLRLQELARGRTCRTLVPHEAPLHFEEVMELEYPVTLLEPLAFILGRLLDQLCARLEARSLATHELRLRLELETRNSKLEIREPGDELRAPSDGIEVRGSERWGQGTPSGSGIQDSGFGSSQAEFQISNSGLSALPSPESRTPNTAHRVLRLPVPTRDAKLLLKLWLLNLKADPPPAPVLKVAVIAEPVKPRVAQGGLFLPLSPDPEKLEVTLARIEGVVGKGKMGSPELVDTHRPGAFRMGPFTPEAKGEGSRTRSRRPGARASRIEDCRLKIADWKSSGRKQLPIVDHQSSIDNLQSSEPRVPDPEPRPASEPRVPNPESRAVMALRVFRPPLRATVAVRAGRPIRVFAFGVRGDVVAASGPWRTSGDWWVENGWQHDEWDVALKRGLGTGGREPGVKAPRIEDYRLKIADGNPLGMDQSSIIHPRSSTSSPESRTPSLESRATEGNGARTTDNEQRTVLCRIYQDLSSGNWFVRGIYD